MNREIHQSHSNNRLELWFFEIFHFCRKHCQKLSKSYASRKSIENSLIPVYNPRTAIPKSRIIEYSRVIYRFISSAGLVLNSHISNTLVTCCYCARIRISRDSTHQCRTTLLFRLILTDENERHQWSYTNWTHTIQWRGWRWMHESLSKE
jgi:hypothetical protein